MRCLEALEPRRLCDGGQLDETFGVGGRASIDITSVLPNPGSTVTIDLVQDGHGSTLVVVGDESVFVVARLTPLGVLDSRFGNQGLQVLPRPTEHLGADRVAADPQGRLYISDGGVITRLISRGKYDKGFGTRGRAKVPVLNYAAVLVPDEEGRLYLAGQEFLPKVGGVQNSRLAVVRLTAAGKLDTDWSNTGVYHPPYLLGAGSGSTYGMFQQARLVGHSLVVSGIESYPARDGVPVGDVLAAITTVRVSSDGTADPGYGDDGVHRLTRVDHGDLAYGAAAVAVAPDGVILGRWNWYGPGINSASENFVVAPDGRSVAESVDLRPDGPDVAPAQGGVSWAYFQSDNLLIASGQNCLYRVDRDGSLDTTWADSGILAPASGFVLTGDDRLLRYEKDFRSFINVVVERRWSDDRPFAFATPREVRTAGTASVPIVVSWSDDDGVDVSSLSTGDVFVEAPDGTRRTARLEGFDQLTPGEVLARYKLTSDDGVWDAADNGEYLIWTRANEVRDVNGARSASRVIGSFAVVID